MTNNVTLTLDLTAKTGRVTDSTNYAALGLDVSVNQAKALASILFQGEVIVAKTTVGDPLIDLQSGATYFEFDLELDSDGEVANGIYEISDYSVACVLTATDIAGDQTFYFAGEGDLSTSFTEGDTITVPSGVNAGTFTVIEAANFSGILIVTVEEDTTAQTGISLACAVVFAGTLANTTFTYSGCTQIAAAASLVADCEYGDNGTFSVSNTTDITTQTITSLTATINYPSWTEEAPIVVTSLPYVNNRLATGTYSVTLSEVISQTQSDGLILSYTAVFTGEFKVSCAGSLCGMLPCIENLRAAHAEQLRLNKISPYQVYVDNLLMYLTQADGYKACGNYDDYRTALANAQAQIDASGCDCSCCDDDTLQWVYNTSSAAQTAIELLQAQVEALENPTVYSKVLFDSVFPLSDDQALLPNNPTFYRPFTDISEITIAKEYLAPSDNGYPKNYVEIEIHSYVEDNSFAPQVVNTATLENVIEDVIVSGSDATSRIKIRLYTYENGTSGITQISQIEGFTIDNAVSSNIDNDNYFQKSGTDLWDTTADLVLDFTPKEPENCSYTYFKITAVALP